MKLRDWNEIQSEIFTPEEIAESEHRAEIIGEDKKDGENQNEQ